MRGRWIVLVFSFSLIGLAALPARAGDLALKRVMLSTGGVGYFEYEAEVDGNAELKLDLPLDQVDDVLKSIVVYDSTGGVGSASLPGREPLAQIFNDLPFGEDALQSPAALLNALQGAEIRIGTSHPITGKLLKVVAETVRVGEQNTTIRNRVSVVTAEGLQQFILEDADSVAFVDPDLRKKVEQALAALASHRAKDRREIVLTTHGTSARTVRVGYVVAAPLWKASYRMTLGSDAKKAPLQGWAVLENMSGQDWTNVELTLLSGNPVSFRQAIYEAYYVTRPEVPVEVAGRILPKVDSGIIAETTTAAKAAPASMGVLGALVARSAAAPAPPTSGVMQREIAPMEGTAVAEEGATQILFRLPVPITLASGRSALVPIIDRAIPVERLSLFEAGATSQHPFAAVKLANDGASGLPPGVLTVYEMGGGDIAYVGDARLPVLPAGEDRLLSYAVDEKTKIERVPENAVTITKLAAAQGVLNLQMTESHKIAFRIAAPATEARRVIIEQAKIGSWRLIDPAAPTVQQTASSYRVTVELAAGEAKTTSFTFESASFQKIAIGEFDDARIAAVTAGRQIDPAAKQAIAELARLRRAAAEKKSGRDRIKAEIDAVAADQARIRDNLKSADKESALHKRYIEKLTEQETQIEKLQNAAAGAEAEKRAADAALDAYVAKLNL